MQKIKTNVADSLFITYGSMEEKGGSKDACIMNASVKYHGIKERVHNRCNIPEGKQ